VLASEGDLWYASDRLRDDIGIVLASVRSNPRLTCYASNRLKNFLRELKRQKDFPRIVELNPKKRRAPYGLG